VDGGSVIARRQGCSRTVYLIGAYAVKFPSCWAGLSQFLLGWLSNRREREVWERVSSDLDSRSFLCPVVGCYLLGLVLVMERAGEVEPGEMIPTELAAFEMFTNDVHPGNIGRIDERLVLLDYA
jgi:hypothetical protein